ncbi:MAG TPA: hypothetical protein PK156_46775, partial [Polyangium sp.]|nr:hypothetical protein [Polyangium sp.]
FKFLSLPLETWVGMGFHSLGTYLDFTAAKGAAGEWQRIFGAQLHNLGNGAFAAYFTTFGAQLGTEMREEAPQNVRAAGPMHLPQSTAVGALPGRHEAFTPVTAEQLQQIAQA